MSSFHLGILFVIYKITFKIVLASRTLEMSVMKNLLLQYLSKFVMFSQLILENQIDLEEKYKVKMKFFK